MAPGALCLLLFLQHLSSFSFIFRPLRLCVSNRCVHKHASVRAKARHYCELICRRFPWLRFNNSSVKVLLDTVQLLASSQQAARVDILTPSGLDDDDVKRSLVIAEALPALREYESDQEQAAVAMLSPGSQIPKIASVVSQAATNVLELTYSWLLEALQSSPQHMTSVLQEYILLSTTSRQLGVDIAKEMSQSTSPTYHLAPLAFGVFDVERALAAEQYSRVAGAFATASAASVVAPETPLPLPLSLSQHSDTFQGEFSLKAAFIGEARGLVQVSASSKAFGISGSGVDLLVDPRADRHLLESVTICTGVVDRMFEKGINEGNVKEAESLVWRSSAIIRDAIMNGGYGISPILTH